jgi:DNA-binding LacI/PurR family transcriptional regulator
MLYKEVTEALRNAIRTGEYPIDSKLPTVQELCHRYSVSAITIRRALDNLREEGFVARQPRIGTTVVNSNPQSPDTRGRSTPTIAYIITSFADSFGVPLLEGVLESARGRAHILLDETSGDKDIEEQAIATAIDAGAEGLMLLPGDSRFIPKSILDLIARKFPVTIIDRVFQGVPVATVASDNRTAATQATQYLFSLGHRNVAFISSSSHLSSSSLRRQGWEFAHASNSISLEVGLSLSTLRSTLPGAPQSERGNDLDRLVRFFRQNPHITGCLTSEYNIALLVKQALRMLGKSIPQDMSVVCFDHNDYDFDDSMFRFTYIKQQQPEIGRSAVDLTLGQIEDGPCTDQKLLPTSLIIGQSTSKIA